MEFLIIPKHRLYYSPSLFLVLTLKNKYTKEHIVKSFLQVARIVLSIEGYRFLEFKFEGWLCLVKSGLSAYHVLFAIPADGYVASARLLTGSELWPQHWDDEWQCEMKGSYAVDRRVIRVPWRADQCEAEKWACIFAHRKEYLTLLRRKVSERVMTFLRWQQWIYLSPGTLLVAPEICTTKHHPKKEWTLTVKPMSH